MEEWNTGYIDKLKKHYVIDVINALLAHATQYEYTRLYPLLAMIKLADKQNPHKQFLYTEILDKAKELGYTGTVRVQCSEVHQNPQYEPKDPYITNAL